MESPVVSALNEEKRKVWSRIQELADLTARENRALTPEEHGTWDGLHERLTTLDARIGRERSRE